VEAMACGLAPVASNSQGPAEIIDDGHNGLLINPRDVDAIVDALNMLITNRDALNTLRRKAYSAAQTYSWRTISRDNITRYRRLLNTIPPA
jgi:glycosyltransferase involved in cell wall biosynthesis